MTRPEIVGGWYATYIGNRTPKARLLFDVAFRAFDARWSRTMVEIEGRTCWVAGFRLHGIQLHAQGFGTKPWWRGEKRKCVGLQVSYFRVRNYARRISR